MEIYRRMEFGQFEQAGVLASNWAGNINFDCLKIGVLLQHMFGELRKPRLLTSV